MYIHEYIEDNWGDLNLHIFAPLVSFMDLDGRVNVWACFFLRKFCPELKGWEKLKSFEQPALPRRQAMTLSGCGFVCLFCQGER